MKRNKEQFLLFRIREFRDEKAFQSLVLEYGPRLERYLRSRLPNQTETDDAYSEVWMRLWNYSLSTKIDSFIAVTLAIGRNVIAEYYKERKRRSEVLTEYEMQDVHSVDLHLEIIDKVDVNILKEIMNNLKEDHAQVMFLRYMEGHSVKDIARQIGKTENATSVIIHRSIKKIREQIIQRFGDL